MKEDRGVYILDTSAILTYIEDGNGSEYVEKMSPLIKGYKLPYKTAE